MMSISKMMTAGAAALVLSGAVLASTAPAEARPGYGGYRGGFAGARFGGYRGGFVGPRYGYRRGYGGVGLGIGAGLALGALAATTYPYGGYGYGYGYAGYPYGGECYWQPRRVFDGYGGSYVQKVQVCY